MKANLINKKLGFNVPAFLTRWHSRLSGSHVTGGDAHTHETIDGGSASSGQVGIFTYDGGSASSGYSIIGIDGGGP
jgi:hypothetical protein